MPAAGVDAEFAAWLAAEGIVPAADADAGAGAIADVPRVRGLLVEAAREARAFNYAELLGLLGHRFTRPKMRALVRTLDAIDAAGAAVGEPGLAVLVVRASDGLPGQGWWIDAPTRRGHAGAWEGEAALAFVRAEQERAFRWHRGRAAGVPDSEPSADVGATVRRRS